MFINRSAFKTEPAERKEAIDYLIESSYPGTQFFILLAASAVIAVVGILVNNPSIVIGSMLVAPFLSPILSLGMGVVLSDFDLIVRSLKIFGKAIGVVVITSFIFSLFLQIPAEPENRELALRIMPSLPYFYVAVAAGVAASFAVARKGLTEFMIGIAVSVSLLPPLATIGVGMSLFNLDIVFGSFQLFVVNLLGVFFASLIIFSLMGFYPARTLVGKAIKKEEKKLEEEKNATGNGKKSNSKN